MATAGAPAYHGAGVDERPPLPEILLLKRTRAMETLPEDRDGQDRRARPVLAAVVPCFRVRDQVRSVIEAVGPEVTLIYCVDDACPERSGEVIQELMPSDDRLRLIRHDRNQGVGGAVVSGYRAALEDGAEVIVKIDGDGQMDPEMISSLVEPIAAGEADYAKGNRFFRIEGLRSMPWQRVIGNAGLSFLTKLSTGYWNLFDPTNGFTAIHARVARALPLEKIDARYFFESDMLFRLGTVRAVIVDVPMDARYAGETSSLNLTHALLRFPWRHAKNTLKRLFYNYLLRDFSMASVHLGLGLLLIVLGLVFGVSEWIRSVRMNEVASAGTVMLASLPIIVGVQFVLNFVAFDMSNIPRDPIHRRLGSGDSSLDRLG